MLKKRIIPILLYNQDSLVKGQAFDPWRRIGSILPAVKVYNHRDVDELIILDIKASKSHSDPDISLIKEIAKEIQVPLTIGGGIHTVEQMRELFNVGADKIVINSICYKNAEIINRAAKRFGSQAIVVSIDVRRNKNGTFTCFSNSGTIQEEISLIDHLQRIQMEGAGEIILTVIDDEGMMKGLDFKFYSSVKDLVKIPLIVSGGIGSNNDIIAAFKEINPAAVGVSSLYSFTESTPKETRDALRSAGFPVRT